MHRLAIVLLVLAAAPDAAVAGKLKINGNSGPVNVSGNTYSGVVNNGKISGGTQPGLTVSGSAAKSVTNNGTITGSSGIVVNGGSGSTITNTGTIKTNGPGIVVGN